jgi:D-3-phosphoglycerate dehydrogenase
LDSILVPEAIADPALDALGRGFRVVAAPDLWKDPAKLEALIPEFDALIVRNQTRVTDAVLRAGRRLRVVGRCGVGLDNIDVAAASRDGIVVTFAPDGSTIGVAELALGFMLDLARKIPAADRDTRAGGWNRARFVGTELHGKTLGLVGCGRIGRRTGALARAFGMGLVGYDPFLKADDPAVAELGLRLAPLPDVLGAADYVSVHLPETPETRRLFDDARFALCKPGAYFVNTARGGVVDEAALLRALESGRLAGAALDVRAKEPPDEAGPLAAREDVILTPHIGAFSREAQGRIVAMVCADVGGVLRGEAAANAVNFDRPKR